MSFDYDYGTRQKARENRRNVRQDLGTSGDPLPDVIQVLNAARALGALLDNASGGRFGIAIYDFNPTSQDVGQGEKCLPVGTAIQTVLDRRLEDERTKERIIAQYGPAQDDNGWTR